MKYLHTIIVIAALTGIFTACNESREIPIPVEQVRPTFTEMVEPVDSAFAFNRLAPLRMRFSEPMDAETFPGNFFLWEDEDRTVSVAGEFTAEGNDVLFQPSAPLLKAHEYFTDLRARVKDANGNGIDKDTLLVTRTEFITDGDYSVNGVPDVIISNGSEDFLARLSVKQGRMAADTAGLVTGFGRYLEMAFTPDGQYLMMTDYNSSGSGIYFLSADDYQIVKKLDTNPDGSPVNKTAEIVVNGSSAYVIEQGAKKLAQVDISSQTILKTVDLPNTPKGLAVLPDGSKIFVGNGYSNEVWEVDPEAFTITKTITVDGIGRIFKMDVSADGQYLLVREFKGPSLAFVNASTGSVESVLDLGFEAASGNNADICPYGDYVYLSSNEGDLVKVDINTREIVAAIKDINFQGLAIYPTGEFIFAAIRVTPAQAVILRAEDLKILRRIQINGTAPWDVAIRPVL